MRYCKDIFSFRAGIGNRIVLLIACLMFCYGAGTALAQVSITSPAAISGCVFNDKNSNNEVDPGEERMAGWALALEDCGNSSVGADGLENFSFNTQEQCREISATSTDSSGCYNFSGLTGGKYRVREVLTDGWSESYPLGFYYNIELLDGEKLAGIDFANFKIEAASVVPVCGNGIKELNEICDGLDGLINGYFCSSDCLLEPERNTEVLGEAGAPNLVIGKILAGAGEASSAFGIAGEKIYKIFLTNNGNLSAT